MLLIAAAALTALPPPPRAAAQASATIQAVARVRVITGARLSFRGANERWVPRARDRTIIIRGGEPMPARLIEFE